MGPMTLPQMSQPKRKRRWVWLLVWTLFVFAGGVAAGPALTYQASVLVERVAPSLGIRVSRVAEERKPAAHTVVPLPTETSAAVPAPVPELAVGGPKPHAGEERGESPTVVAKPAAAPTEKAADSEQPAAAAEEPVRSAHAVVEPPTARPHHGKDAVKAGSSAGAHSRKVSGNDDPFASDADTTKEPKVAASSGKSKSASESAAAAKGEAEPKSAKSQDSLDNLMAGGVADSKGKKRDNKDLDALLKDVQMGKSEPPAPKHEAPAPASALSPADISRVMAGVKVRGNACAQRLGQKGIAELKITVGKDGHVTDVNVGGKIADTPLAACIDKATRVATFPASTGLKFDYRIDVR